MHAERANLGVHSPRAADTAKQPVCPPVAVESKDNKIMEAVPVTVLPPTTGKWEPIRNEPGVVTGYMEMFNRPEDLYFTVPGASRCLDAHGNQRPVE